MAASESTATAICPACGLAVDLAKPHARLLLRPDVFHDDRCVGYYEGRMNALAKRERLAEKVREFLEMRDKFDQHWKHDPNCVGAKFVQGQIDRIEAEMRALAGR